MRKTVFIFFVLLGLPLVGQTVETKMGTNISGSMPSLRLSNATIFPQTITLSVAGTPVEQLTLETHSETTVFVECRGSEQRAKIELGIESEGVSWKGDVDPAGQKEQAVAIWISSQRQGRSKLEALLRQSRPNLKLKHLSLSEAPESLAEYHGIALVLLSAGDVERLTARKFSVLRHAVALGLPLLISAREARTRDAKQLSALTNLEFDQWQPVKPELLQLLPSATRIATITMGNESNSVLKANDQILIGESSLGFGSVRLLAMPFATLRKGTVSTKLFGQMASRMSHPMRWLERRVSDPAPPFFLSALVPLSGETA